MLFKKYMDLYFNPRPPRGGATAPLNGLLTNTIISIHAPREGGRLPWETALIIRYLFQSTPPARGGDVRGS